MELFARVLIDLGEEFIHMLEKNWYLEPPQQPLKAIK